MIEALFNEPITVGHLIVWLIAMGISRLIIYLFELWQDR